MANADGSDNMLNRVMPKDNIGLAALLKVKDTAWESAGAALSADHLAHAQHVLVCTAHIHWDPEFCDVKLIQTMMLSNELKQFWDEAHSNSSTGSSTSNSSAQQRSHHKHDAHSVQLLLCGDFNSLPDSGVVEFLSAGRVSNEHADFKELGYKSCMQRLLGTDNVTEFTHPFKLTSAYAVDVMPYTNFTFEFKGIIDYIFYTNPGMVPLGLLGPLSLEWLQENRVQGCPHPHIPSDHFPLLVELEMFHGMAGGGPAAGGGGGSNAGGPVNGRR